mmetsp:Transcript_32557/g.89861  ORF Transcript_32557/g.89861 Transcript_32557/m.89861 type:complete len:249 (+) Transcript_32557:25-771(+)
MQDHSPGVEAAEALDQFFKVPFSLHDASVTDPAVAAVITPSSFQLPRVPSRPGLQEERGLGLVEVYHDPVNAARWDDLLHGEGRTLPDEAVRQQRSAQRRLRVHEERRHGLKRARHLYWIRWPPDWPAWRPFSVRIHPFRDPPPRRPRGRALETPRDRAAARPAQSCAGTAVGNERPRERRKEREPGACGSEAAAVAPASFTRLQVSRVIPSIFETRWQVTNAWLHAVRRQGSRNAASLTQSGNCSKA